MYPEEAEEEEEEEEEKGLICFRKCMRRWQTNTGKPAQHAASGPPLLLPR